MPTPATLILQDGEKFSGTSFWYEWETVGETVFNTGMTGYPETLTDPSYKSQILVCTYPLLGNYGVPDFETSDTYWLKKHFESDAVHIAALIVSEYSENYNHQEWETSLSEFLKSHKIPAITWIDTRYLTQKIRDTWCQLWKIQIGNKKNSLPFHDPNTDLLSYEVCTQEVQTYGNGSKKICLVDMWVKNNILRNLLSFDTTIVRVPWDYPFMESGENWDWVFISNGPWDPALYTKTIEQIQKALRANIPLFGICLGNQLLALASWAKTYKLPYGHRGQNQPCKDSLSGKCIITSQNHSFAIDESTLPSHMKSWFTNINDGTNEWIYSTKKSARSVQFHPESSPGPHDAHYLFADFIQSL